MQRSKRRGTFHQATRYTYIIIASLVTYTSPKLERIMHLSQPRSHWHDSLIVYFRSVFSHLPILFRIGSPTQTRLLQWPFHLLQNSYLLLAWVLGTLEAMRSHRKCHTFLTGGNQSGKNDNRPDKLLYIYGITVQSATEMCTSQVYKCQNQRVISAPLATALPPLVRNYVVHLKNTSERRGSLD